MPVENSPVLQALQQQAAASAAASAPAPAVAEAAPKTRSNKEWRDEQKQKGGAVTTISLTPAAVAAIEAVKDANYGGYGSQSALISTAVLRLLGTPEVKQAVLEEARAALEYTKREWLLEQDDDAVALSVRGFAKLCRQYGVSDIEFKVGE